MKTTTLFLIALAIGCAIADRSTFGAEVTEMMSSQAMAADAVDTVEQLLLELKDSIYEE